MINFSSVASGLSLAARYLALGYRSGGGDVDSGLVGFQVKGTSKGIFIISRNWLVLGGSRAPDVKTWEKKVCIMYLVSPVPEPLRRTLKMAPF